VDHNGGEIFPAGASAAREMIGSERGFGNRRVSAIATSTADANSVSGSKMTFSLRSSDGE
jgi:hypothetical protein